MSNGAKVARDEELVEQNMKCIALAMADALKAARGELTEEQAEGLIEADGALIEAIGEWHEARSEALGE